MKIKSGLFLALVLGFALSACDIIEGPKKDYSAIQGSASKKVLLEEFTGHRCPNCPNANEEAQLLDSIFGENLVIVSVHATAFADPVPSLGYPADYGTPMGEELADDLGAELDGLPNGAVNRRQKGANLWVWKFSEWAGEITSSLAEAPKLALDVASEFDETTRQATITVDMEYFEDATSHGLVVVITEDSIISKQTDLFTEYENYVHRHVLRDNITGSTYGEQVNVDGMFTGDTYSRTFTYDVSADWDAHHCEIVAYVIDYATREILQVNEAHLMP